MEQPTAFFDKTFDEAYDLLVEGRDFIAADLAAPQAGRDAWTRARLALETTRFTSRMAHIMAWLLARRAVHAGELTPEEAARPPYRLGRSEQLAEVSTTLAEVPLPESFAAMLERSQRLYVRVARLDEMIRKDTFDA